MKLSPRKANSDKAICYLNRDNKESGTACILVSTNHVSIWKDNEHGYYSIPKKDFNKLIDFYNREQKITKK